MSRDSRDSKDFNIREIKRESELEKCADVIRKSFATVAIDFGITEENCPNHTSFTTSDKLRNNVSWGWLMYGLYHERKMIGYVSLSKTETVGVYEMHNLAVLPEERHKGYGRYLLDFCKAKVKELGGNKITVGIIEESKVLKDWYRLNGFTHSGTKIFPRLPFIVGFMEVIIL